MLSVPSSVAIRPAPVGLAEALSSARETRALLIGSSVLERIPAVFREQFPGARAVVVCDTNTWTVAGQVVQASLLAAGLTGAEPFVFRDPALYAEHSYVEPLEQSLAQHDAIPVAVGSGTINDLVKLAAHRAGRAYLCVATAASMDGYTAFGASITYRGAKQTFNCPAPRAVVADIDVIRRAPAEMTASGYADLQAKITAGADWMLADALGVEPIEARAWTIVQGGLDEALADPAGARAGHATAITPLVEGLMLGGFAMQWTKSSRPASGAEHQFSHLWDMEHHTHDGIAPSHGFKVGIATLAVTTLYEQLLAHPMSQLDVEACCARWPDRAQLEADIRRRFADTDFVETAVQETLAKHVSRDELRTQLHRVISIWPELRPQLSAQLVPSRELRRRLQLVGAPSMPEAIGLTRERLRGSFIRAYHLRRRFTVLDLAVRAGLLESCLDTLFATNGPWSSSA
ncbi:MAG: sn-glycerol-1-phosphate dehydrogenase [Vicinamibacterales bacterium]